MVLCYSNLKWVTHKSFVQLVRDVSQQLDRTRLNSDIGVLLAQRRGLTVLPRKHPVLHADLSVIAAPIQKGTFLTEEDNYKV